MSRIAERIARSLPGASFELDALVRLVGIEETDAVPTAAVTCRERARLLINPAFVAEHCERDEHLFLLVMHEMWHVLLGHTTLYGRPTKRHNIAFDALINAGLARQHPEPAYRGFFERLNRPDVFPELLLRPPVGWPKNPVYPDHLPGLRRIMKRLYPQPGSKQLEPLYEEIITFLQRFDDTVVTDSEPRLVGDHEPTGAHGGDPMDDTLFGDVVRRIVGSWPPPPVPMTGRDAGGVTHDAWIDRSGGYRSARAAFAAVIRLAVRPDIHGAPHVRPAPTSATVGPGPLPNLGDRTHPARRRLLGDHVLANQRILVNRRQVDRPVRALVYLDVSGSMLHYLPHLIDLLVKPVRQGLLTVRQFSTAVEPLSLHDLVHGQIATTDGTHIDCVLADLVQRPERRAVIVTDGYVGTPNVSLRRALEQRNVRLHALLPHDGWTSDLAPHSTVHHLPRMES